MFRILLLIFIIAIGIFFSFSWAIVYHLIRFGINRKATKVMVVFFIAGSLIIASLTLWSLLGISSL